MEVVVAEVEVPKLLPGVKGYAKLSPTSVPHDKTPLVDALTSQAAALRPETTREVEDAVPEAVIAVVEANGKVFAPVAEEVMTPTKVEAVVVVEIK